MAFFAVFAVAGIAALIAGLSQVSEEKGAWVGVGVGAIFTIVGATGIVAIIKGMKKQNERKALATRVDSAMTPLASEYFPELPGRTHSRMGGILLKPTMGPAAKCMVLFFITAFWNGISLTAAYHIFRGNEGFFLRIFISLFVLIGAGLALAFVHAVLGLLMTGGSGLEISTEPVPGGQRATIRVMPGKSYKVDKATVKLVCQERVTYRQGTDTRTDTKEVLEQVVLEQPGLHARAGSPMLETTITIPANAMHSFDAPNNKIIWSIRVILVLAGRPDLDETFTFRVSPPGVEVRHEHIR